VGGRLARRLSDGTKVSRTRVAPYGRGLGLSQVTFARADLTRHVTDSFDSEIWTKGGTTAGRLGDGVVGAVADVPSPERLIGSPRRRCA
jgi:putative ABC transport system permease protein